MVAYRSSKKTVYSAKYHLVWCPKYCRGLVGGRSEARLKEVIEGVVADFGGQVIEVEVMADDVHLLAEVPPTVALSNLVQLLKGRSWRVLRVPFPHLRRLPTLWSPSWFVSTGGAAHLEVVRRYVEGHKTIGRKGRAA